MKNAKKLNLKNLNIQSFVTSLENKNSETVKGGAIALNAGVLKICNTGAYCGNTADGGNGCSQVVCTDIGCKFAI